MTQEIELETSYNGKHYTIVGYTVSDMYDFIYHNSIMALEEIFLQDGTRLIDGALFESLAKILHKDQKDYYKRLAKEYEADRAEFLADMD